MEAGGWAPPRARVSLGRGQAALDRAAARPGRLMSGRHGPRHRRRARRAVRRRAPRGPQGARVVGADEAAAQAGGRCRSYLDPQLGHDDRQRQPPGAVRQPRHVRLSARGSAPSDRLVGPDDGRVRLLRPARSASAGRCSANPGRSPGGCFDPSRRVPGTRRGRLPGPRRLLCAAAGGDASARSIACEGVLWERLIEPLLLAALNTDAADGSAALAGAVDARDPGHGRPGLPPADRRPTAWRAAFVDPALAYLAAARRARCGWAPAAGDRAWRPAASAALDFRRRDDRARADDAVDPGDAALRSPRRWCPDLPAPDEFRAIVNGHFTVAPPAGAAADGRRDRRRGRMAVRLRRPHLGDGQRRATAGRRGRARTWRPRSGATSPRSRPAGRRCRPGRSSRSGAPPSPPRRSRTPSGRRRRDGAGAISSWPATGPRPACPPPSKARSAPATRPPGSIARVA